MDVGILRLRFDGMQGSIFRSALSDPEPCAVIACLWCARNDGEEPLFAQARCRAVRLQMRGFDQ